MSDGFRIGQYTAHTRLGMGGMAEVWLARRDGPGKFSKDVVVKRILPHMAEEPQFVDMFLNEARLAALLNHPNLVQVFDLGEDRGSYFIVMEYVVGKSLRQVMKRFLDLSLPVPLGFATHVVARACEGLHHAHEMRDREGRPLGLVHRDVSPENILVSRDGQVKVVDFGIAKATSASAKIRGGTFAGKLAYMSPEHAKGLELDRRADVFGLAIVLCELLSNDRQDVETPKPLMEEVRSRGQAALARLRDDAPAPLRRALDRALVNERDERTVDARMLGLAIEECVRETPTTAADVAATMERLFGGDAVRSEPTPGDSATMRLTAATPTVITPAPPDARPIAAVAIALVIVVGLAASWLLGFWAPGAAPPTRRVAIVESVPTVPMPSEKPALGPGEVPPAPTVVTPRERSVHPKNIGRGRLDIRVSPWGEVSIDEKSIGVTPLAPIELSGGRHRVTAVNSELKRSKTVSVEVRPGRSTVLEIDLRR